MYVAEATRQIQGLSGCGVSSQRRVVSLDQCRQFSAEASQAESRFAYSAIAAVVPRTEAAERKFQSSWLKLVAGWSVAYLAAVGAGVIEGRLGC